MDAILSSPNSEASDALFRAAFAAGRTIVPQLKAALKDDRTAEFAAQSLAYLGGEEAITILSKLVDDPRDLNLRRFYYGALAEMDTPQSNQVLLDVIKRSDAEPDRTVSQVAIHALTVRSGGSLVPKLRDLEEKIKDVVIHDDLDSAIAVIEGRGRYLASPEGGKPATSIESALRTYFAPALLSPSPPNASASSVARPSLPSSSKPPAGRVSPRSPQVKVDIGSVVLSADKTRALARVTFEDPEAMAQYDMIVQKRDETWRVVSVWLGSETEKPEPKPTPAHPRQPSQD